MKLYRCKTPTNVACACGKVHRALEAAGVEFETERVGWSRKPAKRQEIMELTGQPAVPVLVDDAGKATHDSKAIIEMIKSGQLSKAGTAPTA
jgi:glutathione S-transferase